MLGILLAMSLTQLPFRYAAAVVLVATPVLALGAKWINFGYFPVMPQLQFILLLAILGALAGLALRRSRAAAISLVVPSIALVAWGAATGVPDDLYEVARVTGLYVLEDTEELPQGDAAFSRLPEVAFAYAEDNSHGTDTVLANKAAILALGVILRDDQVARVGQRELKPGGNEQRVALRRRVTIHGRGDLPQHFWVSAALTVLSDEKRALTVGITKEMRDSTSGGSGFSIVDMVANKAGIGFAVLATQNAESARAMRMRLKQGCTNDTFVPSIHDLPEGLSGDVFQ